MVVVDFSVDVHAQIGYGYTHIGCKAAFASFQPRESRRCAVHQDAAARARCAVRPTRAEFLCVGVDTERGHRSGAAQRELARLEESALIVVRRIGRQKHYQANAASPLYAELRNIVLKTVGLAEPLREALRPLSSAIRVAFVYGSVAKATDRSASDIDVMIISENLTYGEVFGALERVTRTVGRKVNPTVYTAAEFSKRARTEHAFVTRVLEQPKLWVIGSEHDLPVAA